MGVADQLGEHAPGAEGDERAEDRVLRHPGQELDASRDHRLHDHGHTDALGRRSARRRIVARSSATPPVSVLCAPASAVLTTTG